MAVFLFQAVARGQQDKVGSCRAPKYKIASTYVLNSDDAAFTMSVRPQDVTVSNLLALACQLRADYPSVTRVHADIFNDERAAKCTRVPTMIEVEIPECAKPSAYVATYHLDTKTGVEVLTLAVDPHNPCGKDIQIDLKTRTPSIVTCDGGVPDFFLRPRK